MPVGEITKGFELARLALPEIEIKLSLGERPAIILNRFWVVNLLPHTNSEVSFRELLQRGQSSAIAKEVELADAHLHQDGAHLRDADVLSITERRHREVEVALLVALPEELFAGSVRPQPRDLPRPTRVRDVGALQRDLWMKLETLEFRLLVMMPVAI